MKSRIAFDRPSPSPVFQSGSFIYVRYCRNPARCFVCTRVGVVDPPLSPLAHAFTTAAGKVGHRVAGLLSGLSKGAPR
jgi:hypothetical protein